MMKQYKPLTTEQKEKFYSKLSNSEQKDLNDYLAYRRGRGLTAQSKLDDVRSGVIRLRATAGKPLKNLTIQEVTNLASLIRTSKYGDYSKNEALVNLKRYVKHFNPSINLEDIQLIKKPTSKRIIRNTDLPTKEDVEKLIKHETRMFWKAFLITQYEAGLRTKECRYLKWSDIDFNVKGDLSRINLFSTKTKKPRTIPIKEATFYLKKLKEEQTNLKDKGEYIFHSKKNINEPVGRSLISMWMSRLSKKTLGKVKWNYLLRHSRGNELYQLSKEGKISKDIALSFMGHSEKMSKVYTHDNSEEVMNMIQDQVYHLEELPPEVKNKYEERIKELEAKLKAQDKKTDEKIEELKKERTEQDKKLFEAFKKVMSEGRAEDKAKGKFKLPEGFFKKQFEK